MSLDFLKAEIAKKKRKLEETAAVLPAKKYVKLGELEEIRQREYMERQKAREMKRKSHTSSESEGEEEKAPHPASEGQDAAVDELPKVMLPREEVMKRLRMRREPITLFGESDIQRAERLRKLELKTPMEYIQGDGSELLKIMREEEDREEQQDQALEDQLSKVQDEDPDFKIEDRPPTCIEEEILFYFRRAWWEWHDDLDRRPETEKRTAIGRKDTATLKQTRAFLKPFFKLLQKRSLGADILKEMILIYKNCAQRDYVAANAAYYRLAIGNAPWPMGVTMVGIHERSAREKLHSASVAHVLNDETQRKYIQGVKRLMTFLQTKYPTVPSKSVN